MHKFPPELRSEVTAVGRKSLPPPIPVELSENHTHSGPHGKANPEEMKGKTVPHDSFTNPPAFPKVQPAHSEADEDLRAHLKTLSHEQLLQRCMLNEMRLRQWEQASSSFVSALALTPEMTEAFYARSLRELLSSALQTLDVVEELRHVECSMPCVKGEAPQISLTLWRDLSYSEWHVEWSPASWWVSVSAVGYRWGLSFNCLTKVTGIYLNGMIRCSFSKDMTGLRIGFPQKPILDMTVESSVGWGAVPLPVREQIETLVRSEIELFVQNRLTGANDMVVVLKRKAEKELTESDLMEARSQAERASTVNLRTATFL
eukprot:TRINITY_DN840_c0_g1_i2.p1 TRINITY_DN840_c0_g1~~TRINITY_DN840_c0_g1_i2.p1  ORF type:complete len:317 (-),score=42.00 TRINITY_DN840_c0_g1_i2:666-1616(-)